MSLTKQLSEQLDKYARENDAPITTEVSSSGRQLSCHFDRLEEIACGVQKICLRFPAEEGRSLAMAEELVARVSYLLESLSVIEADATSEVVQVRSTQPARSDRERAYYELLVEPEQITFGRYAQAPGEARRMVSAWLTREVVEKLVDDLDEASRVVAIA